MVDFLRYYFTLKQITSMRWFSFLARFVFICNLCFIADLCLQYSSMENLPQWLVGTLLVLGWFPFGTLVNIVFVVITAYLLLRGKRSYLPVVLTLANIIMSVFQIIYYLIA
jgi:hypothetical protein